MSKRLIKGGLAAALGAMACAVHPDGMTSAAPYLPDAAALLPGGYSLLLWAAVVLPLGFCIASLFWLIRSDRRRAAVDAGRSVTTGRAVAANGLARLSF